MMSVKRVVFLFRDNALFFLQGLSVIICERGGNMAKEVVEAPITGTIISIEVKVGDKVEEGDVLLYIESMKMENPIMAPVKGTVAEIKVAAKQVVESGKPLVVIEY
jgi:acetyl-CoA carboxylase biotin carboxyl carrier protein